MSNTTNHVTLNISKEKMREVIKQSLSAKSTKNSTLLHRLVTSSTMAIDYVMRVLRHEYSDYDQQWKGGDWNLVSRSFAVEVGMLLSEMEPVSTKGFVSIITEWMRRENRI